MTRRHQRPPTNPRLFWAGLIIIALLYVITVLVGAIVK